MRISFLLGPAGSGKTHRCLNEVQDELKARPDGPPLIFIAPRQATYQLERRLLEGESEGYIRLRILSFERLAEFVFECHRRGPPRVLSDEGRVMVLRSILNREERRLSILRGASRGMGFAREISDQIRELEQAGLDPGTVRKLSGQFGDGPLGKKLGDLAILFAAYREWLAAHGLEDGDALLGRAAELIEQRRGEWETGGVWLDGFAQLTPPERRLLAAVLSTTRRAVLAFCLESKSAPRTPLAAGYMVHQAFARCFAELEARFGEAALEIVPLRRDAAKGRFAAAPSLAFLEEHWWEMGGRPSEIHPGREIQVAACMDPEAEAVYCARAIRRFVRSGGRYRETAVLTRGLQNDYPRVFRRVFREFNIPFFLDHREPAAHHPLAELTRGALRIAAHKWKHGDLFNVFKCGLMPVGMDELDELENEALERGWEEHAWKTGFNPGPNDQRAGWYASLNRLRERLVAPFLSFERSIANGCDGVGLADSIRTLWRTLDVRERLENWAADPLEAPHATVWEQMNSWVDNLELAFADQSMRPGEWLEIVDSGLENLSVGVIPPLLDQVLIGAVDRSRNPDLKIVFVVGANEGVFPSPPARKGLLSEDDRMALWAGGWEIPGTPDGRLAREQFYAYIAFTRARERVVVTYSRAAPDGAKLNPSRFISRLKRLFPLLEEESWNGPKEMSDVEHACELLPMLGGKAEWMEVLSRRLERGAPPHFVDPEEALDPELTERLYTRELNAPVSAMERFAACPFRFFVEHGLRVKERKEFTLDVRGKGSFQHEILAKFHQEARREGKRWRDLSRAEAVERIGRLVDEHIPVFEGGIFASNPENRFIARMYKTALQEFIVAVIDWFQTNEFDPEEVELPFGYDGALPGWRVPLENGRALILRGRIDRVDLCRQAGRAWCVVFDYKSGEHKPRRVLMEHGIQQQLLGYLLALTRIPEVRSRFGVEELVAAGCFFVPLRGKVKVQPTRTEALSQNTGARYAHLGICDLRTAPLLDKKFPEKGGQFEFHVTSAGAPIQGRFGGLSGDEFSALLSDAERLLRRIGARIFAGEIAIRPFKLGGKTACDLCKLQPICRFDPWAQEYNVLAAKGPADS